MGTVLILMLMATPMAGAEMTFHAGISESRYQEATPKPPEKGVVGINLEIQQGSYPVIMEVYPSTPAAKSGLHVGDTIVSVDTVDVYDMSRPAVDEAIPDIPGTRVRFVVQRDGRVFPVTLTVGTLGQLVRNDVKSLYRQELGP
jgi:C-terminal processing protease CtpA/Prc